MPYVRQGFIDGMTLNSNHMMAIEDAIVELYELIRKAQVSVSTTDDKLVITQDLVAEEIITVSEEE